MYAPKDTCTNESVQTYLELFGDLDRNVAARDSDQICAMKGGEIAAFGTVEEIMNAELLAGIFQTKIEIIAGPRGPIAID